MSCVIPRIRISAGQGMCGGSIDWHRYGDDLVAQWGVSGALEFADDDAGRAAAEAVAAEIRRTGRIAYLYGGGYGPWAPPAEAERFPLYSPRGS